MTHLIREERWIPVTESGDRWAPRSRDDAEQAMRVHHVGGTFLDGEPWDGITHIVREVRYVTEWAEEPDDNQGDQ